MSTVISKNVQIGADGTASNNFTAYQPATPDGTLRIGNGNSGSVTDAITLTSAGSVGIGTSSPANMLHLSNTSEGTHDLAFNRNTTYGTSTGLGGVSWYNQAGDTKLTRIDSQTDGAATNTRLIFSTASSGTLAEKVRITSAGDLLVGATSAVGKLVIGATGGTNFISMVDNANGGVYGRLVYDNNYFIYKPNSGVAAFTVDPSGNMTLAAKLTAANDISIHGAGYGFVTRSSNGASGSNNGFIRFDGTHTPSGTIYTGPSINAIKTDANYSTSLTFKTTDSGGTNNEAMRISGGNLLVGTTTAYAKVGSASSVSGGYNYSSVSVANQADHIVFKTDATTTGSISRSGGSAVAYNTTSDQRLKENIVNAPDFGSVIDSIQVRSFDWKIDSTHQRAGFIAQELVTVAPEAVHQPEDTEQMMAVDYSKLVPMLVKEIQSLRKRLAAAGI